MASKYYSEITKQATYRYKKGHITQMNISFQKESGYREMFQKQADKRDTSVNRYILDLLEHDSKGNLVLIPPVEREQVKEIMDSLSGSSADVRRLAENAIKEASPQIIAAVNETAAAGNMKPAQLIAMILSSGANEATVSQAKLLLKCIEAAGAPYEEVLAFLISQGADFHPEMMP